MKRLLFLCIFFLSISSLKSQDCEPFSVPYPNMGINIPGAQDLPWVNLWNQINPWHSGYFAGTGLILGSDGWPIANHLHKIVIGEDVNVIITIPADTIKISYKGTVSQFSENDGNCSIVNSIDNYPNNGYAYIEVLLSAPVVPTDEVGNHSIYAFNIDGHVEEIKIMRPGFNIDDNTLIHPDFMNQLKKFSTFRFMPYLSTNTYNTVSNWDCTSPLSVDWDTRWNPNAPQSCSGKNGGSWEYMVELCNQFNADMWINIPIIASDQFVDELAKMIKENLKPSLNVNIEIGNETWNWGGGFCCSRQIETLCNGDGDCHMTWSAERLKQVIEIFANEWGWGEINNRIRGILCGQIGYGLAFYDLGWTIQNGLEYIRNTYNENPGKWFYAVGAAPYFGPMGDFSSVDNIIAKCDEDINDVIFGEYSTELWNGIRTGNKFDGWAKLAFECGMKIYCYEGGPDMDYTTGSGGVKDQAMRDPRMQNLVENYYTKWFSRYGYNSLFCHFLAAFNTSGLYTLGENFYQTSTRQAAINNILTNPAPAFDVSRNIIDPTLGVRIDCRKKVAYMENWADAPYAQFLHDGTELNYFIAAQKNGRYNLSVFRNSAENCSMDVFLDGNLILSNILLPSTSTANHDWAFSDFQWTGQQWTNYAGVQGPIDLGFDLTYGVHMLKFSLHNENGSWQWIDVNFESEDPPAQPGNIQGDISACLGNPKAKYTIEIDGSVCEYEWEVTGGNILTPSGGSGAAVSGQGTNLIYVDWSSVSAGTYSIRVRGFNDAGVSTWRDDTVTVSPCGFTINPNPVCLGSQITITPVITESIITWNWNFGPGAIPTSSNVELPQNVTYSYEGDKTIKLIVETSGGQTKTYINNIIVGNTVPGVSTATPSTVNAGEESSINLTGATGSVVNWEYSTDNVTWVPMSTVQLPLLTGALALSTWYRAVVQADGCNTAQSTPVRVTVNNPVNPGEITPAISSVISGSIGPELTLAGYSGTIIRWESKPAIGNWNTILGETGSKYTPPLIVETISFRVIVDISGTEYPSSIATISAGLAVDPGVAAANMIDICAGNGVTLTLSGSTGNIQWQESTDGVMFTDLTDETSAVYVTPNLSVTTWYRAEVSDGATQFMQSNSVQITVSGSMNTGTIDGAIDFCETSTPPELSLSGSDGDSQIWQESTDDVNFTDITNATALTYTPTSFTGNKYFRVLVTKVGCGQMPATSVQLTVDPLVLGGSITAPSTVNYGQGAGNITLSGNGGNVIMWQSIEEPYTGIWNDLIETSNSYTTPVLTISTSYRAVIESGSCGVIYSDTVIITVLPVTETGYVDGASIICENDIPNILTQTANEGTIIGWQSSVAPFSSWTDISNTNNTYQPAALTVTTRFRAFIDLPGATPDGYSQPAEITVDANSSTGTIIPFENSVCSGSSTILNYSGGIGNILNWQSSNDAIIWNTISYTSADYNTSNLSSDTYFNVVIQNGVCPPATSDSVLITTISNPATDMILSDTTICEAGNVLITISYTETGIEYILYDDSNQSQITSLIGDGNSMSYDLATVSSSITISATASRGNCISDINDNAVISVVNLTTPVIMGNFYSCPATNSEAYWITTATNAHTYIWSVEGGEIISDNQEDIVVSWNDASGTVFLKDSLINSECSVSTSLIINIQDNTKPDITCPTTEGIEAEYENGEFVYSVIGDELDPIISDTCSLIDRVENSLNSASTLQDVVLTQGDIITWNVYDMASNHNSCEIEVKLLLSYEISPPTAFSPNGDGINDEWKIEKIGLYPDVVVEVLNRQGKKVFESEKGYGTPWDGNSLGRVLPVDSYFYIIKEHDKLVKKGVVTIIK